MIPPEVAATAAYALQGVMDSGGTGSAANPWDGTPLIGKTGSHNEYGTMMIESSTKAATAVYIGRWKGDASIWGQWYNGNALQNIRYDVARDMQAAANALLGGDESRHRTTTSHAACSSTFPAWSERRSTTPPELSRTRTSP